MGAIVGALYAAGHSGKTIRKRVDELTISREDKWEDIVKKRKQLIKWFEVLVPAFSRSGLVRMDKLVDLLYDLIGCSTFEELEIPLKVVATDYWKDEAVVFEEGELLPAIKASMAIPGVFPPVKHRDHVLIDGGVVNLVPYDLLENCEIRIGVDVTGKAAPTKRDTPDIFASLLHSFEIAQHTVLIERMKHDKPDIMVAPELVNIDILDFDKIDKVYEQSQSAVQRLRKALEDML